MNSLLALAGIPATVPLTDDEQAALDAWGASGPRAETTIRLVVREVRVVREVIEGGAPMRAATRNKLQATIKAAEALYALLGDAPLQTVIRASGKGSVLDAGPPDHAGTRDAVQALSDAARFALTKIPRGRGRSRVHTALGLPTARLFCAVAALQMLRQTTGKRLGSRNPIAAALCVALWRASGGTVSDKVDSGAVDGLAAWERHLEDARTGGDGSPAAVLWSRLTMGDLLNNRMGT